MKIFHTSIDIKVLLLLLFILTLLTNNYFSFEDSLNFGAKDGADYFLIADNLQNIDFGELEYHKAWRFIVPITIGVFAEILNLDTYITFRIFTIISCFTMCVLFYLILKKLEIDDFHIFFLILFLIFNPYLCRYFLALPTMINDLIFINSGLVFILGIIKNNKKIFYIGLFLALITRQNSIFFLLSVIIVKFFFKSNSLIKYKDIFLSLILTILVFIMNNKFANSYSVYNESYSLIYRFNLFTLNYTIFQFIEYNLFPLIILFPPLIYVFFEKKSLICNKTKSEFFFIILIISFFIISVAYVGGPMITGRNLLRLINLAYPLIILTLIFPIHLKKNKKNSFKYFIYTPIFFIWSLHPTFSNIQLFNFLRF